MAQTDRDWLRETFPGAVVLCEGDCWAIAFKTGEYVIPCDWAAQRSESKLRRALGFENDKGAEGWRYDMALDMDAWGPPCAVADRLNDLESFLRAVTAPKARQAQVYECDACSSKPGSPTLCDDCLRARVKAGAAWRGCREDWPRIHAELCALRDGIVADEHGRVSEWHGAQSVPGHEPTLAALRDSDDERFTLKAWPDSKLPADPPSVAEVKPPTCRECGAVCRGASLCAYCLHRLDNATRSPLHRASELGRSAVLDAVGEARERGESEPSFYEGCAAWSSATWDDVDWGKR